MIYDLVDRLIKFELVKELYRNIRDKKIFKSICKDMKY
jgi:hypothetical protein